MRNNEKFELVSINHSFNKFYHFNKFLLRLCQQREETIIYFFNILLKFIFIYANNYYLNKFFI